MARRFKNLTLVLIMVAVAAVLSMRLFQVEPPEQPRDKRSGRFIADYGSWHSVLSAKQVYAPSDSFGVLRPMEGGLYFTQADAERGGKVGVNKLTSKGEVASIIAPEFDVKSRVHEYGGAPVLAIGNSLFAVKSDDQRLYRIAPNQAPVALTPADTRHADCVSYPKGSRIICVREDHRLAGDPTASIVALNLNFENEGETLVSGSDFYAAPRVSPDNRQLAWISWQQPNMPWDNTELWVADLDPKGGIKNPRRLLANLQGAITQPLYSPGGELYVVADFNNWWNLYRITPEGEAQPVLELAGEFARPDWLLGNHSYAFESEEQLIASVQTEGRTYLLRLHTQLGISESIAAEFAEVKQVVKGPDGVYFIGSKITPEKGIYRIRGRGVEWVYGPRVTPLDPRYISRAESIQFTSDISGLPVYGYFYGPMNPDYIAPDDQRPPLIVMLHGGPTWRASLSFRRDIQFWTSRGFAVLDVNYRGSSGFGRDYRQSLYGLWGRAEVEDAIEAADYVMDKGWVDADKVAIRGMSAGGFSVLSAMAFYHTFKAGVVYSGISDLEALDRETHKFEQGYLHHLVGELKPNSPLYRQRSPLYHLDDLKAPLLLVQGAKDPIVPARQSEAIYAALKRRGVPVAYLQFDDEGHGVKKPLNRIAALNAELSFYGQVFGFTPADKLSPLTIDNALALGH
ncbi:S9 family peptidase [Shewanella alkalitolerans]|uniref:S9 family peptidase n=1 Tax=Shewanella alkalitolerans TaxID=2864209 RepID=UPI001C65CA97|nr:S9 family peptidase [Shewanella alkalitolerans]QYJ99224.1 S9 family peptidase [Shewanella alkalitolerans]